MSNDRLGKECVWCDHKINKNTKYEQKQEKHKYSKKIKIYCKSYHVIEVFGESGQLIMNLDPLDVQSKNKKNKRMSTLESVNILENKKELEKKEKHMKHKKAHKTHKTHQTR